MTVYVLEFEDQRLPPTMNKYKRLNKWEVIRERNYWINIICFHMNKNPPPKPLEKYELEMTRYSSVQPDYDGLVGSFKIIVDSMQEKISAKTYGAGLTLNDNLDSTGPWICKWEKCKENEGKVKIIVREKL